MGRMVWGTSASHLRRPWSSSYFTIIGYDHGQPLHLWASGSSCCKTGRKVVHGLSGIGSANILQFWLTSIKDTVKSLVYWMRRKTIFPTLCVSRSAHSFSESGFVKSSRESLIVSLGISSQFGQRRSSSQGGGVSYFIKTAEQASWTGNKWESQPDLRRAVMWEGGQLSQGALPGACWSWKNQPQDALALGNIWVLGTQAAGEHGTGCGQESHTPPPAHQEVPWGWKEGPRRIAETHHLFSCLDWTQLKPFWMLI